MKVNKILDRKIERNFIFVTGTVSIPINYFIKKIEKGIEAEDNKNYTLKPDQISLKLSTGEQINNIVIINENELMINISGPKKIRALIFSVKENRILTIINK